MVVVVPLPTRDGGLAMHVELDAAASGLDQASYARCEDVRSVFDERLVARLGVVPVAALFRIETIFGWLMGLASR